MKSRSILKRIVVTLSIPLLIGGLLGYVGSLDVQSEQMEEEHYCEMVKIWKSSHGQAGWPAYDGESQCKKYNVK
jgi:hypothetical protein